MINCKHGALFVVLAIVGTVLKIWLVSGQSIYVHAEATYDDRLFLNIAHNIANGDWLGKYNHFTLTKGPVYPAWISLTLWAGISLHLAQHVLYIFSCFIFIAALNPLLKSISAKSVLFFLLVFNPMSYSIWVMPVVQREGIYPALTMILISSLVGLLLRRKSSYKTLTAWSAILGVSLSLFWLTREEGVWFLPALFFVYVYLIPRFFSEEDGSPFYKLMILGLPIIILCSSLIMVCVINHKHYGSFTVNELKGKAFKNAYNALTRVQDGAEKDIFPVSRQTREILFTISPSFSKIQTRLISKEQLEHLRELYLDRYKHDPDFAFNTDYFIKHLADDDIWKTSILDGRFYDDIAGGLFLWAFRDAVALAGYHDSASLAADYYKALADEIDIACDEGKLECQTKTLSLIPPLNWSYFQDYLKALRAGFIYLSRFDGFYAQVLPSKGSEESLSFARKLTGDNLFPVSLEVSGRLTDCESDDFTFNVYDKYGALRSHSLTLNKGSSGEFPDASMNFINSKLNFFHFNLKTSCVDNCTLELLKRNDRQYLFSLSKEKEYKNFNTFFSIESINFTEDKKLDALRITILDIIGSIYKNIFFFIAIFTTLIFLLYNVLYNRIYLKNKFDFYEIVIIILLIMILSRIFLLSLVHITAFPAISSRYLAPVYPLYISFVFLCLYKFGIALRKHFL